MSPEVRLALWAVTAVCFIGIVLSMAVLAHYRRMIADLVPKLEAERAKLEAAQARLEAARAQLEATKAAGYIVTSLKPRPNGAHPEGRNK